MDTSKMRSLKKMVSWRIIATLITGVVVFLYTGRLSDATYMTLTSAFVLMIFYYIHERFWSNRSNS